MKLSRLRKWLPPISLVVLSRPVAHAQQDEGPVLKPKAKPKPSSATILVVCDLACNWTLDGEAMGSLAAGGSKKVSASLGQHLLDAMTTDGPDKVERQIEIKTTAQTIVRFELQPVRDARVKVGQEAKDKLAQQSREQETGEEVGLKTVDFVRTLNALAAFSPLDQEAIHTALWMRTAASKRDLVTLNNLLATLKACRMEVDAIALPDLAGSAFSSGEPAYFKLYDNPMRFLNLKNIDAVLFLGFLNGKTDAQMEDSPYLPGYPNWLNTGDVRSASLTRALLLTANAGKDIYLSPGTGNWVPMLEASPIDASTRARRIAWLGNGSAADLIDWCRSIRSRQPGLGTDRFINAATAAH